MFSPTEARALSTIPYAKPTETALVQAWLAEHADDYDGFDFNLRVGDGRDPGPLIDPAIRQAAITASKRIIDVVGYRADGVRLIEVKGRMNPAAIGQLHTYKALWTFANPGWPILGLGVICAMMEPDLMYVLNTEQIPFWVYPALVGVVPLT